MKNTRLLQPKNFKDERGYFLEIYSRQVFIE
jgi:dTDP-4-dehydrorhamnose 3,5-epimerase-like enzyme